MGTIQRHHLIAHKIRVKSYGPPLTGLNAKQFNIKNFKLFCAEKGGRSNLRKQDILINQVTLL